MVRTRVRAALAVLAVVAAVVVMVRLSVWQWDKARAQGRLLNYTYAVEWLLFAVLTVGGVGRLWLEGRRAARGGSPEQPEAVAAPAHAPAETRGPAPVIGPPLAPGQQLEEVTWVRLRRRLGLGGGGPDVARSGG